MWYRLSFFLIALVVQCTFITPYYGQNITEGTEPPLPNSIYTGDIAKSFANLLTDSLYYGHNQLLIENLVKSDIYLYQYEFPYVLSLIEKNADTLIVDGGSMRSKVLMARTLLKLPTSDSTITYFDMVYSDCINTDEYHGEVELLLDLGTYYRNRGDRQKALENFIKAFEIINTRDFTPSEYNEYSAACHNGIGIVFWGMQELEKAKSYFRIGLKYSQEYPYLTTKFLNNIGGVHKDQKTLDSALYYYLLGNRYAHESQSLKSRVLSSGYISRIYFEMGCYDEAIEWLAVTLDAAKELSEPNAICQIGMETALSYYELGLTEKALQVAQSTLQIAEKNNMQRQVYVLYDIVAKILLETKNTDSAKAYQHKYAYYNDPEFKLDQERKFGENKVDLVKISSDQEMGRIKKYYNMAITNNNVTITIVTSILLVFAFTTVFYQRENIKKRIELARKNTTQNKIKKRLKQNEKKLADYSFGLIQKSRALEEIEETLKNGELNKTAETKQLINPALKAINNNKRGEKEWENFYQHFGSIHADFFDRLLKEYPELSKTDLKHCALVRMNLSVKESAEVLNISYESTKVARSRLKKKMKLGASDNLSNTLLRF